MSDDERVRHKLRFNYVDADGKQHRYRWREPNDLRELRQQNPRAAERLSEYSIFAADLINDIAQIPGTRLNQFDNKPMNLAEESFELQLIAPTLALYENDNRSVDEQIDHEKVARLACVMYLPDNDPYINHTASLDLLKQELRDGNSRESQFLRGVQNMLNDENQIATFDNENPEINLKQFIKTVHTYIHSVETTRIPLLDPIRHENNAEHSVENALFGIMAQNYIAENTPPPAIRQRQIVSRNRMVLCNP